jgi:hypothetical protein
MNEESIPQTTQLSEGNMKTVTIPVDGQIEAELVPELEKQSVYISPWLRRFTVSEDGTRVVVTYTEESEESISRKVTRFLDAMRRGFRPNEKKTLATNARQDGRPYETNVFAKLVDKGWVIPLGPGQVALSGAALHVAKAVDEGVAAIGRKRFGGEERMYPTVIPGDALVQCGYTNSMPQHLSIVTHMQEDFDAIDEFRGANLNKRTLHIPNPHAFGSPKVCLCPALCYHTYPTLAGKILADRGHVETSVGRIARYESSSMVGLDRLWEFTQRSIIWLGGEHFCNERREWAIETAVELAESWDIDFTIESASDPFFASVATAMTLWQRTKDLKFEMRAGIEPAADGTARTIAAASFNLHGLHFGSAFDIRDAGGREAHSGCASWGIERWVLVIFTQHGVDVAKWPASLREALNMSAWAR